MAALAVETPTRECRRCRRTIPETDFYKARTGHKDAQGVKRMSICKPCSQRGRAEFSAGIRYDVPAEPFAQWLDRKYDLYMREWQVKEARNHRAPSLGRVPFAEMLGTNEKMLGRIRRREQRTVHIDTVDHVLLTEGSTCLFELYPDLYGDEEVAA